MAEFTLHSPGPRPFFGDVAYHLWGADCDFDSDGNDDAPPEGGWTELTVTLRPGYDQRIDVDALEGPELALWIRSDNVGLAERTARFLLDYCGGELKPGKG